MIALGALSLALVAAHSPLAAALAIVGLILFGWTIWRDIPGDDSNLVRLTAVVAFVTLLLSLLVSRTSVPDSVVEARLPGVAIGGLACVVILLGGRRHPWRVLGIAIAFLGVAVVTGQLVAAEWNSSLGTDIYQAHKAAGAALTSGENPYTDAVRFFNGSPFLEDDAVLEGYPYPPVVLLTFGLVAAFTDPRLISTVAWLAILIWVARPVLTRREDSSVSLAVFLMLATLPGWPLIWYASWTEPLSLLLLLAAVLSWKRSVLISGIVLGVALASKQYLIFLAPLLALYRDDDRWKRLGLAFTTALITLIPPLLLDPAALYRSMIGNLAAIGFRPDSVSIVGLLSGFGIAFKLPEPIWLILGLAVSVLVGLRSRALPELLGRAGVVLGCSFAIGLAFTNYWFLVLGMLAVSAVSIERHRAVPAVGSGRFPGSELTRFDGESR
jgi:hypothetical protein